MKGTNAEKLARLKAKLDALQTKKAAVDHKIGETQKAIAGLEAAEKPAEKKEGA